MRSTQASNPGTDWLPMSPALLLLTVLRRHSTMNTLPKVGQRIQCVRMAGDLAPIEPGSRGTVLQVQRVLGEDHIDVQWDSGRTLSMMGSIDKWLILKS